MVTLEYWDLVNHYAQLTLAVCRSKQFTHGERSYALGLTHNSVV